MANRWEDRAVAQSPRPHTFSPASITGLHSLGGPECHFSVSCLWAPLKPTPSLCPPPPPTHRSPDSNIIDDGWVAWRGEQGCSDGRREREGSRHFLHPDLLSAPTCPDAISGPRTHLVRQRPPLLSTSAPRRTTSCLLSSWTTERPC